MQDTVSLDDYEEIICPDCGNDAYYLQFKILRKSALDSTDGKEIQKALPVHACANCNKEVVSNQEIPSGFETVPCHKCSCTLFSRYQKLLQVSALKSATGKEEIAFLPLYACSSCSAIHNIQEEKSLLE